MTFKYHVWLNKSYLGKFSKEQLGIRELASAVEFLEGEELAVSCTVIGGWTVERAR